MGCQVSATPSAPAYPFIALSPSSDAKFQKRGRSPPLACVMLLGLQPPCADVLEFCVSSAFLDETRDAAQPGWLSLGILRQLGCSERTPEMRAIVADLVRHLESCVSWGLARAWNFASRPLGSVLPGILRQRVADSATHLSASQFDEDV
jgi:hypothetical protein